MKVKILPLKFSKVELVIIGSVLLTCTSASVYLLEYAHKPLAATTASSQGKSGAPLHVTDVSNSSLAQSQDTASTSSNQPQTSNKAPATQSKTYPKTYIAPVCTKIPVPYTTSYQTVTYLSPGQTQSYGGVDGYRTTCTPDSTGYKPQDIVLSPYNKTVYVGAAKDPSADAAASAAAQSQADAERAQRIHSCILYLGAHGAGNSSAVEQCYTIR